MMMTDAKRKSTAVNPPAKISKEKEIVGSEAKIECVNHTPGIRRPGKFICRYHQDRHHVQGTFRPSLLFCHLRIGHVVIKELSAFISLFLALDRWVPPVVARVVNEH
jgi:hypothetical protein